jgi:hypothetical protein
VRKHYEHFKHKTIYTVLDPASDDVDIQAFHHETQKIIFLASKNGSPYSSEDGIIHEVYYVDKEENPKRWAREYDDFHGFKELEDGTKIKRFTLLPEEHKYERPKADIVAPANYKSMLDRTLRNYKKWLIGNNGLLENANNAEIEKDRKEALHENTQQFRKRFAGVMGRDEHKRLSVSLLKNTWEKFMKKEYRGFLNAHVNLSLEQIMKIGIDKFIYIMGWEKPSDVSSWHNNKLRVGACCHCQDQFIPMIFQHNHGLCSNCRPFYSAKAIRSFAIHQLNDSQRYHKAQNDLLMDFYILFYHDKKFRELFLVGSESATEYEQLKDEVPEWAVPEQVRKQIPAGEVIETTSA